MRRIKEQPVGYRLWKLSPEGYLKSTSAASSSYNWEPKINRSICNQGCPETPANNCHCGFNCYYTLPKEETVHNTVPAYIWGAIAVAGNIRKHRHGFRSAEAQILCLYFSPEQSKRVTGSEGQKALDRILERVKDRYEVEIFDNRNDFIEYTRIYGKDLKKKYIQQDLQTDFITNSSGAEIGNQSIWNNLLRKFTAEEKRRKEKAKSSVVDKNGLNIEINGLNVSGSSDDSTINLQHILEAGAYGAAAGLIVGAGLLVNRLRSNK